MPRGLPRCRSRPKIPQRDGRSSYRLGSPGNRPLAVSRTVDRASLAHEGNSTMASSLAPELPDGPGWRTAVRELIYRLEVFGGYWLDDAREASIAIAKGVDRHQVQMCHGATNHGMTR